MALPAIAGASRIAIGALKPSAEAIAALVARLGLRSAPSLARLKDMALANPLTAGLVIAEVYGITSSEYATFLREHEDLREQLELFTFQPDSVDDTTSATDITRFSEEFGVISQAVNQLGSFERLMTLRRALEMPQDVIQLYANMRILSKKVF